MEANIFQSRLNRLMIEKHVSQQTLAKGIGIARQTVAQYQMGSTQPTAEKLLAIADFFNVSVDYLLGRTSFKTPNPNIRTLCEDTGLSEEAITKLEKFKTECVNDYYLGLAKLRLIDAFIISENLNDFIFRILYYARAAERTYVYENNSDMQLRYLDAMKELQDKYGSTFSLSTPVNDLRIQEYNLSTFGNTLMEEYKNLASELYEIYEGLSPDQK